MALLVRNNGSSEVTLAGTTVKIPAGDKSNVTSELRGLSGAEYSTLEKQRLTYPVQYVWSDGEAEFNIRPIQDTNDYSVGGLKNILMRQVNNLARYLKQNEYWLTKAEKRIEATEQLLKSQNKKAADYRLYLEECLLMCSRAMGGDTVINLGPDYTVTAVELNAAAAGTVKRNVPVIIESANATKHVLCSATLDITPGYTPIATGTGAAPTIDATVTVDKGVALKEATFITDAGATKTYEVGDTITIQVDFPGGTWIGNTAVAAVTKTWTVA